MFHHNQHPPFLYHRMPQNRHHLIPTTTTTTKIIVEILTTAVKLENCLFCHQCQRRLSKFIKDKFYGFYKRVNITFLFVSQCFEIFWNFWHSRENDNTRYFKVILLLHLSCFPLRASKIFFYLYLFFISK